MSRRSEGERKCTITIDVRNPRPSGASVGAQDTGRFNRMEDVVALLCILQNLCGPDAEVFFDFGVISIRNVDLAVIVERLALP